MYSYGGYMVRHKNKKCRISPFDPFKIKVFDMRSRSMLDQFSIKNEDELGKQLKRFFKKFK